MRSNPEEFGEDYYGRCFGGIPYRRDEPHWFRFFEPMVDRIVRDIRPRRVLDAGCGMGFVVELLRRRGVEAHGFDISRYAISQVHPSVAEFCWTASATDEITGRYDLITCIEIFGHVPPPEDADAIANFCRHADDVLFSASPLDPDDPRHHNLNPPEHFAELFAQQGFTRDCAFDASFVTPFAVRYRRTGASAPQLVRDYERKLHQATASERQAHASRAHAEQTIRAMERSWFWKARAPWARITGR